MNGDERSAAHRLLETGILVGFRIVNEQLLTSPDEAEFGLQLELQLQGEEEG